LTGALGLLYELMPIHRCDRGGERCRAPSAFALFQGGPLRAEAKASYNLQRYTVMPRGGHFAALEEPELLVEDICAFFRTLR